MQVYREQPVIETLHRQGDRLRAGFEEVVRRHALDDYLQVLGRSSNLVYATRGPDKQPSQVYRALFMQELIRGGILAPSLVVSYSHSDNDIDQTIEAIDQAAEIYARALETGVDAYLNGPAVKPVFRSFN